MQMMNRHFYLVLTILFLSVSARVAALEANTNVEKDPKAVSPLPIIINPNIPGKMQKYCGEAKKI